MDATPPILQRFKNMDGDPLQSLPTHISEEHGDRYVLWSDIQHAFKGVDLSHFIGRLFVVDGDTIRLPLCLAYSEYAYKLDLGNDPESKIFEFFEVAEVREKHKAYSIRKFTEKQCRFEDEQESEDEELLQIELTWTQTPNDTTGQYNEASQGCTHESPDYTCALHLKSLLRSLKILNDEVTEESDDESGGNHRYENLPRDLFQKLAANTRYFYSMTLQELERLEALGMKVKVDGMVEEQLYTYLRDMHQETLMAEYRNNCKTSLWNGAIGYDYYYPAPRLFIVLPADLDTWIDSDTTTHSFRLFYMCENKKQKSETPEDTPQHVHLSNHPGYNLQRPQEFFQIYGDYVLRLLQMVECGYSDNRHVIPPLNSFKILCGHAGCRLSKKTIGALLAKSIAYIQKLSPSRWIEDSMLSAKQSAMIKAYLEIPDNCNGQGNLHRNITIMGGHFREHEVLWMCQVHNERQLHQEALQELQEFAKSHGGHVSMQEATLRVELYSDEDAGQFCTFLLATKHTFDLSIKINWKPTRSSMVQLCRDVASTGTATLEIDGITLDTQPEGNVQHLHHLFSDVFLAGNFSRLVTLLNYPRAHERRLYYGDFSLRMLGSPAHSTVKWVDLLEISGKFKDSVCKAKQALGYSTAAREFRSALDHLGLPSATEFTMASTSTIGETGTQMQIEWAFKFDLQELAFIDVYSKDMCGPKSVLYSQSLQRLVVHLEKDLSLMNVLVTVLTINTQLQDFSFSYYGHDILYYMRYIVGVWSFHSTSSLTLIDHTRGMQGRTIMQLARDCGRNLLQSCDTLESQKADLFVKVWGFKILQLDCDHVFSQLSDVSSAVLVSFMKFFPTALTLLTLDVSHLSRDGLISVEKILRISNLEYLKVICTPVKSRMSFAVARVLRSIQWSTLKSLTITGDHVETWISIWMGALSNPFVPYDTFGGPQLLYLHLSRTGSAPPQPLSHTSALFVHGLVYMNPSVELVLTNFILKDDFC